MQRLLTLLSVILIGSSVLLQAQVAPTCTINTLAAYEASGSCVLAGSSLRFNGFTFSESGPGAVPNLDAEIVVTPHTTGKGGGFTFSGFLAGSVGSGQTATYTIGYTSNIIPDPPTGSGANIGGDPPFGNVVITEAICADSTFGSSPAVCSNTQPSQSLMINNTNPPQSLQDSIVLNPGFTSFASIANTIVLGPSTCASGPCAGFDDLTTNYFVSNGNPVIPPSGLCNGVSDQRFSGNVTVPSGATCVILNTSVGGNITVQSNATLDVLGTAVYGTIIAGTGSTVSVIGGSIDSQGQNFSLIATDPQAVSLYNTSANYTVEINGSGGANPQGVDIEGTHIYGSLVTNGAYSVLLVNNSIVEQNAEFFGTTNVPSSFTTSMRNTLCNVTIGGTLEVESNTAAFGLGAGNGCSAPPSSGSVHVDGPVIVTGNNVGSPPSNPSGGSVTIDMNYIAAGLSCSNNTPGPSQSAPGNNIVGGGATGQCAGFGK